MSEYEQYLDEERSDMLMCSKIPDEEISPF